MSNETPEIEGQQTIDEATASATELLQEGDGPTPEADALDDRDAKKDDDSESPEDEPAESDPMSAHSADVLIQPNAETVTPVQPSDSTHEDTPDEHYFRIQHQMHNAGADQPHSTNILEPMKFGQYLRTVIDIGKTLGEDVEGILRSL